MMTNKLSMTDTEQMTLQMVLNELNDDLESSNDPINISNIDSKYCLADEIKLPCPKEMLPKYSVLHINIQGLGSSYSKLKLMLEKMNGNGIRFDFILLCETFLKTTPSRTQELYNLNGYHLITRNRKSKNCGGLAIYIKNNFSYNVKNDLSEYIEGEFESLVIEVKTRHKPLILSEVYRVPNTNESLSIERYRKLLENFKVAKYENILIGTDQNFDFLRINEHNNTSELFNVFITNSLIPLITRPTRVTDHTATLIDNIYTTLETDEQVYSGIILTKTLSDHYPVFSLIGETPKIKTKPLKLENRDFSENNIRNLQNALRDKDWDYLNNLDTEEAFNSFTSILNELIDEKTPIKYVTIPAKWVIKDPWITPGILKSSSTLDKLYAKCVKKSRTGPAYLRYIKYRNNFNRIKRKMKYNYFNEKLEKYKQNTRETWKLLRELISKQKNKNTLTNSFIINGENETDPIKIANEFCDYFSEVGNELSKKIPKPKQTFLEYLCKSGPHNSSSIFLYPTSCEEINDVIASMKNKRSLDNNNISSWLLKQIKCDILAPLYILINKSMETGVVPDCLKVAKVIPIHKAKDKALFSNYRPISILPIISKVLEKIVHKRVSNFINDRLAKSQYGFRSKHSTIHAVSQFYINTMETIEQKQHTLATYLDLSRAFDTLDYSVLLKNCIIKE